MGRQYTLNKTSRSFTNIEFTIAPNFKKGTKYEEKLLETAQ
jgi:hypothetical protein